jgi:Fe-Mn family superoxide dismutase
MTPFTLPELPYALDALAPAMSRETLEYHWGKHHRTYVANLNRLIAGTPYEGRSLEEIVRTSSGAVFNNAAQAWNHAFYWRCLSPEGGGEPKGALAQAIAARWGSFAAFRRAFSDAAAACFGSGWTWLVKKPSGALEIMSTSNAGTPLTEGLKPVLTIDVWEHAYYIDWRNARPSYIEAFFERLADWRFAEGNFEAA